MLYEFTRSGVAIENDLDNIPNAQQTAAPKAICDNILEPLRLHLETKKAVPNFAAMKRRIIAKQVGNIRDVGAMVGYDFQAGIPMRIEAGLLNGSGLTNQKDYWTKGINFSALPPTITSATE